MRSILFTSLFVAAAAATPTSATAAPVVAAQSGDASIARDAATGHWIIAAGGATLTVTAGPNRDFQFASLTSPAGGSWLPSASSAVAMTVNGSPVEFGSRASGFQFERTAVSTTGARIQFDAAFTLRTAGLRVTRHVAVTDGSPTFEVWTSFEPLDATPAKMETLNAVRLTVPAGRIHWLTGLQGDSADADVATAFTLKDVDLESGGQLALGADSRSSSQSVPWYAVDGTGDEFYSTLMWSGAWSLSIARSGGMLHTSFGLAPMETSVTAAVDAPHALFGVAAGGLDEAAAALRSYFVNGIRGGQPLTPLVTYNTWFAYGTDIDEASMRDEMERAAGLGAELFVIDAGWYTGAGASGPFDFDSGLGTWQVDPARFPNGLMPLRDYAHELGLKFGIWVEPERVNLATVGGSGAQERWLATAKGDYGSDHAAQICLSDAGARQWVLTQLETLIDAVGPDYLKWDNNFFVNCDRPGHGHGDTDGNFQHVAGLYNVLATLRQRYPDLLIENVSGGGNRLDYGMMQYTDVAWMDDRTAPSIHVRHNLEGLGSAFPLGYLLSFVTNHDGEPLHDSPDLPLYVRSRMAGALGLCFRTAGLSDGDLAEMTHQIDIYKNLRATLGAAAASLLSAQTTQTDAPPWDVLQATAPDSTALIVYAFQADDTIAKVTVKPTGLNPSALYAVRSVDSGDLGTATGADLMSDGIDIVQSPVSAAHILLLVQQ